MQGGLAQQRAVRVGLILAVIEEGAVSVEDLTLGQPPVGIGGHIDRGRGPAAAVYGVEHAEQSGSDQQQKGKDEHENGAVLQLFHFLSFSQVK